MLISSDGHDESGLKPSSIATASPIPCSSCSSSTSTSVGMQVPIVDNSDCGARSADAIDGSNDGNTSIDSSVSTRAIASDKSIASDTSSESDTSSDSKKSSDSSASTCDAATGLVDAGVST